SSLALTLPLLLPPHSSLPPLPSFPTRRSSDLPPRHCFRIPRVACRFEIGVLSGTAHRKLIHILLAHHHRIFSIQLVHDGCIVDRVEIFQHAARACRQYILGTHVVLDPHRATEQRTVHLIFRLQTVHRLRPLQSSFSIAN